MRGVSHSDRGAACAGEGWCICTRARSEVVAIEVRGTARGRGAVKSRGRRLEEEVERQRAAGAFVRATMCVLQCVLRCVLLVCVAVCVAVCDVPAKTAHPQRRCSLHIQ